MSANMEWADLEHCGYTLYAHASEACAGEVCLLHNRSDHHMRGWPQWWRSDAQKMERICPIHGVGHPDPDELAYLREFDPERAGVIGIHGCCGCCRPDSATP